jgi:hypothetical protein
MMQLRGAAADQEIGNYWPWCFEQAIRKNSEKNAVVTLWFCNILKNNLLASL